jgi:hypothetical protein
MGQADALRALDAEILDGLQAAGLADEAVYTPPIGSPVPCNVYVDDGVESLGEDSAVVVGPTPTVSLFRTEVPTPVGGATVTIGTRVLRLDRLVEQDASMTVWTATDG